MTELRLNKMKFCFLFATIYMTAVQCYALLIRNPAQPHLVQRAGLVSNSGRVYRQSETPTFTNSIYRMESQSSIVLASYMDSDPGSYDEDDELIRMRMEIDQLKREAAQRIDALSDKIVSTSPPSSAVTVTYAQEEDKERELSPSLSVLEMNERGSEELVTPVEKTAVSNSVRSTVNLSNGKQKNLDLDMLEGTQWKMALNIGREPGES